MNCFNIAGPQIAEGVLKLSPAHYGYWNFLNTIGMLLGGLLSKKLLARFSSNTVIAIGFFGMALGIVNLCIIWYLGSESVLLFFLTSATLYCFGSFLYAGGTLIASNALADKATSSAAMSFIFLSFSTVWVILLGYLGKNVLVDYIIILSLAWLIVVILFIDSKSRRPIY
ncbi:MAG: hypothetical protein H0U75_04795 [Legionella sp.]|nr:hypothetical protein [Legionella sp.]